MAGIKFCFFLLVLISFGCERENVNHPFLKKSKIDSSVYVDSTLHIKSEYIPDSSGLIYTPKRILSLEGDFNGDGIKERLYERYFDVSTGKNIDLIPAEGGLDWLMMMDVESDLVSDSDLISSLKLSDYWTWGILSLLNLGDINLDGLDEIAVVSDNADFSNLSSCRIYQFCNHVWKEVFTIGIHEEAFWYPDDFDTTVFYREIPGYLEKKDSVWYYVDHDDMWRDGKYQDEKGYPVFHPLRIRKKCACEESLN